MSSTRFFSSGSLRKRTGIILRTQLWWLYCLFIDQLIFHCHYWAHRTLKGKKKEWIRKKVNSCWQLSPTKLNQWWRRTVTGPNLPSALHHCLGHRDEWSEYSLAEIEVLISSLFVKMPFLGFSCNVRMFFLTAHSQHSLLAAGKVIAFLESWYSLVTTWLFYTIHAVNNNHDVTKGTSVQSAWYSALSTFLWQRIAFLQKHSEAIRTWSDRPSPGGAGKTIKGTNQVWRCPD